MNYDEALKRARESRCMSQQEIATILKTTQQQISLYETGKRELKTSQIIKLCKEINISADYLLGLTNEFRPLSKK